MFWEANFIQQFRCFVTSLCLATAVVDAAGS